MKKIYVIVLMLFQYSIYCQGTVLEYGESGSLLKYETAEIGSSNERFHTLSYGYSYKRKIDIGMNFSVIDEDKFLGGSISGYLDSRPLKFKTSLLLSKPVMPNSDWNKGINLTVFHFKSGSETSFTPSIGFTFAGTKEYFFNYGMDLLIHAGNADLLLGIEYIVPPEFENYFSLSCGILFHHRNEAKLFDE